MYYIGISGWNYDDFNGIFYPDDLKERDRLEFYTQKFNAVEINASFYRIFKKVVFENWYKRTPEDFVFTAKLNRQFTHKGGLKYYENLCEWFFDAISGLKEKLKVILIQLPPRLKFNKNEFLKFIKRIVKYTDKKFAIEPRNESWFKKEVYSILKDYNIALCLANTGGRYPEVCKKTADFSYTRLHGPKELYASQYSLSQLKEYKKKIDELKCKENYIFFDNTAYGYAVKNAFQFQKLVKNVAY